MQSPTSCGATRSEIIGHPDIGAAAGIDVRIEAIFRVVAKMLPRFKAAGAMRQVVTQVWNQEGSFILGNLWEYGDEKAFIACQELFREAEVKLKERTGVSSIIVPSRGVILHDIHL